MTQVGIEPATFRFVAQHLNHCATAVPSVECKLSIKLKNPLTAGHTLIWFFSLLWYDELRVASFFPSTLIYTLYSWVSDTCSHNLRSKVTSLCTSWNLSVGGWKNSPTNFNIDARWRWVKSLTLRPIYWRGKISQSPINTMFCEF